MGIIYQKSHCIIQMDPPEHFCNYEIFSWTTPTRGFLLPNYKGAISQKGPANQIHFHA